MIKKFAAGVLAIVVVIVLMAAMKPDRFTVTRSVTVAAPPQKIAALIADFHQWQAWSPWERLDPAMTRTYSGAPAGKGAVYAWQGNKEVGRGRMEILDVGGADQAAPRIAIKLDFLEPFASSNVTEFALTPGAGTGAASTTVTWTMTGPMLFVSKLMTVFVSMDALIGKDFEKGLAQLKAVAEK